MSAGSNNAKPALEDKIKIPKTSEYKVNSVPVSKMSKRPQNSVRKTTASLSKLPPQTNVTAKLRGAASTPINSPENKCMKSFGDISKISLNRTTRNNQPITKPDENIDLLYNDYLCDSALEIALDENVKNKANDIDFQIAALKKRLEHDRLLLENTTLNLKNISLLSEQQCVLDSQEKALNNYLHSETERNTKLQIEALRDKLKFSCDKFPIKNVIVCDSPMVSIPAINKLNETLQELNNGFDHFHTSSPEISRQMQVASDSLADIQKISTELPKCQDQIDAALHDLNNRALEDASLMTIIENLHKSC